MSSVGKTLVKGHGLQAEGQAVTPRYPDMTADQISYRSAWVLTHSRVGQAFCECGEWSPELPSTYARKAWHRAHKAEVTARDQP